MTTHKEEWKKLAKRKSEITSQFSHILEHRNSSEHPGWSTSPYEKQLSPHEKYMYGKEGLPKPRLNLVEFGRASELAPGVLVDESMIKMAYDFLLKDFFQTKSENFPDWPGLPEIKSSPLATSGVSLSWYAAVPKKFVIDPEQKKEEDLWNS